MIFRPRLRRRHTVQCTKEEFSLHDTHSAPGPAARFFSILNENLWQLVQINFIFLLTSLPVITFGPSFAALCACLSDMVRMRRRDEPVLPRYFAAFRACFLPALPRGILLLAGTAVLGFSLFWYGSLAAESWFWVPFTALSLLGLIFFTGIAFHLFFLLPENRKLKTGRPDFSLLRAAAWHALERMKQTLAGLVIWSVLLAAQFLLLPATVPLVLTLGLSIPGLVMAQACLGIPENA